MPDAYCHLEKIEPATKLPIIMNGQSKNPAVSIWGQASKHIYYYCLKAFPFFIN